MTTWKRLLGAASAAALLAGALPTGVMAAAPAPASQPAGKPEFGTFGFDTTGMDRAVKPGDDFYKFANGAWMERTQIPADRSNWTTFGVLTEKAAGRTRKIIQDAAANPAGDADTKKIGDYYASFMDEAQIEAKGLTPLQPQLAELAAIKDKTALSKALGKSLRADVDPLNASNTYTDRLFGVWIGEDFDQPTRYAAYLMQGGLGMPDRDYYLDQSPKFAELRAKYQAHVAAQLKNAGIADADAKAARILALETEIAKVHASQVDTNDVTKANNTWTRADFKAKAPGIDWDAWFAAAGLSDQQTMKVWHPAPTTGIAALVGSQPLETWKDYLTFHAIARAAPYLPKKFADEAFAFNGTALSGTPQQQERWKRAVNQTNSALGEAVGKLYVKEYFPPQAKAEAEAMVANIIKAFGTRIDNLDWMSPQTKAKAKEKLGTLTVGVGYPDKWRDYSGLEVVRGDALGNAQRAGLFEYAYQLQKLHGPVDRNAWHLLPQEVNALNSPLQNSIVFPAAILEPPFFDAHADAAVNYGAIGGVIGHEISHSFDNLGALFDAQGGLHNWWTEADFKRFDAAGDALAAQYDGYRPLPDQAVNGRLTLGENIADVAGLSAAYDAYRLSLGGQEAPVIDGFTGDQRFFLGWAQNYRSKYREAALRRLLLTNVHAPGETRADTVRNLDAWYGAFDVKPGETLYLAPDERVRVW
ncbi:M13 family metallopeptidase [Caulobacter sp. 17J80-11]|uniref:M13 family metallopeptidase n=1 Tax=Caulobacter sp. 17J80-11 TaxID=2763502 RepID=UPI001653924E|nr:M13 family metallopeptidase [Caulobacter sp. 17J80-11]MBC6981280.1 M13 family metallopeptidase [Caulobacter sp. 17J80-11]